MLLDIGLGLAAAIIAAYAGDMPLTNSLAWAGIFYTLLPDLDALWYLFRKKNLKKGSYEHRDSLHFPLAYIPIGTAIMYAVYPEHALLFALGGIFHFIHDSIGIGWGVEWLFPFSRKHFSFLYIYRPKRGQRLPRQWAYAWEHRDLAILDDKYGDANWVKNIYLRAHPYAIAELVLFLAALIAYLTIAP